MTEPTSAAPVAESDLLHDLAAACRQRAAAYGFLSRLFRVEVDEAYLGELEQMRFPASTGTENLDEGYRLIARYLSGSRESTVLDLAVDYTRTFIGNGIVAKGLSAHSAAYPYESVYTSEKRLLMQEARDQVLAIYRAAGLAKQDSWHDGEDHLALELEYMQVMANRAAERLEAADEEGAVELLSAQEEFLRAHLTPWVPQLAADMRTFAKTDFYRGLASLAEGYLEAERAFFDEVLADDEDECHCDEATEVSPDGAGA
ncbi:MULTISPECIES: TorD/DmsD family molecular chaperone [Gordonibacter]|uniref:Molecular chaperone TorD family protein n=1 Tax=Gordonibacter faecis TaxID=3047475 RepID=A0ABT7DS25_9ACTN|nr:MULTISPECIES: molecular chaperone TorD family protein [unclassified Gordonibacter]MDJ1651331.1 molecular chaperone TorD family protein [Gordonibacter sp. KGMB12511]HIW76264.1 molecular chaperone TorD family protein [Candidatus Gordonibacter avicola]